MLVFICRLKLCARRMCNFIGCICSNCLHCAFSNVSLNCLPEKMHSHIGCMCLIFLHCAFSNVSSNRLREKRHSHIGCICLTFLRCAFSNVSSNCLHGKITLVAFMWLIDIVNIFWVSHLHLANQSSNFWDFAKNLKIFQKPENLPKIWKYSKKIWKPPIVQVQDK